MKNRRAEEHKVSNVSRCSREAAETVVASGTGGRGGRKEREEDTHIHSGPCSGRRESQRKGGKEAGIGLVGEAGGGGLRDGPFLGTSPGLARPCLWRGDSGIDGTWPGKRQAKRSLERKLHCCSALEGNIIQLTLNELLFYEYWTCRAL